MKKFAAILAITTTAYGLAFDGPLPTPVQDLYTALNGYTPRPTNDARSLPELFRRQKANPAVCGYLDGDAGKQSPLSCIAHYPDPYSAPNPQGHPTPSHFASTLTSAHHNLEMLCTSSNTQLSIPCLHSPQNSPSHAQPGPAPTTPHKNGSAAQAHK